MFYSLIVRLLLSAVLGYFFVRSFREPAYRRRWKERLGFVDTLKSRPVWFHAASVGEVQAAGLLIRAFRKRYPQTAILLTTFTPSGSEKVRAVFKDTVAHSYLPFDTPGSVRRFLQRVRPRALILVETELWPNLIKACARRGIPVAVVSARLAPRSLRSYRRFPGIKAMRAAMQELSAVAAQTPEDAQRFIDLGAKPDRVQASGNVKLDFELEPGLKARGESLRNEWNAGSRPVWIAASTHEGEEEVVLQVCERVRQRLPRLLTVLVPRHPQRFDRVAALCGQHGLKYVRRSKQEPVNADIQLVLGDTMGELMLFFAAGDVAFLGGSLVPVGGHNPIEPAVLGLPLVCGPHVESWQGVYELLGQAGAVKQVSEGQALADEILRWLTNPQQRRAAGRAAADTIEANRGAVSRTLDRLKSLDLSTE